MLRASTHASGLLKTVFHFPPNNTLQPTGVDRTTFPGRRLFCTIGWIVSNVVAGVHHVLQSRVPVA